MQQKRRLITSTVDTNHARNTRLCFASSHGYLSENRKRHRVFLAFFFSLRWVSDRAFVSVTKKSTNENGTHDEDGVVSFILLAMG